MAPRVLERVPTTLPDGPSGAKARVRVPVGRLTRRVDVHSAPPRAHAPPDVKPWRSWTPPLHLRARPRPTQQRGDAAGTRNSLDSQPRCRSSSTTSRSEAVKRSRTDTACSCARRPARARPSSASSPSTWRWPQGRKCFYTTPIKALSNQKYGDLVERYGADSVGLLTGDNSINGEAPIVVMTTEVLRNMLYAESPTLDDLGYVVMDEVHYLADRFRGAVWEEVILHLPDLGARWSACRRRQQRGGVRRVARRGPRRHHGRGGRAPARAAVAAHAGRWRLYDLFVGRARRHRWSRAQPRACCERSRRSGGCTFPRDCGAAAGVAPPQRRTALRPPSRAEVVDRLDRAGLLPAIVFIFSRAGCDAAVTQCVRSGLRLNTADEVAESASIVDERAADLPDERPGCSVTGNGGKAWNGASPRTTPGMLPVFKETVEELFVPRADQGRVRHRDAGAGHQHARPDRRDRGPLVSSTANRTSTHARRVHAAHRACRPSRDRREATRSSCGNRQDPSAVAGLASHPDLPAALVVPARLQHGRQPGRNYRRGAGARAVEQSFAQFLADRAVVGLARRSERDTEALRGYRRRLVTGRLRRVLSYLTLRKKISEREKALAGRTRPRAGPDREVPGEAPER